MALSVPIFTVDAFTDKVFTGNPAAVCPLDEALPDAVCQKIALELNLSETTFITQVKDGGDFHTGTRFGLRWFTPTNEVRLCGHATLSAAHILFSHFKNGNPTIIFETLSGELRCTNVGEGSIEMDFPELKIRKMDDKELLFFGTLVKECIGELPLHDLWYVYEAKKVIIVLDDKVDRYLLESLKPNQDRLLQFDSAGVHVEGVCITMKGTVANGCVNDKGQTYDFVSRYFAPWFGIAEDPVCGSMHCGLTPYWSSVLAKKRLYAHQSSSRGGDLNVELRGDGRVYIRGNAVTVIRGQIAF